MSYVCGEDNQCTNCWCDGQLTLKNPKSGRLGNHQPYHNKISLKKHQSSFNQSNRHVISLKGYTTSRSPASNHSFTDLKGVSKLNFEKISLTSKTRKMLTERSEYQNRSHCPSSDQPVTGKKMKLRLFHNKDGVKEQTPSEMNRTVKPQRMLLNNQLIQTKRPRQIPKHRAPLNQLSRNKTSFISVFDQEQKPPRIQQSTIMINFFSPNSQVTEVVGSSVRQRK